MKDYSETARIENERNRIRQALLGEQLLKEIEHKNQMKQKQKSLEKAIDYQVLQEKLKIQRKLQNQREVRKKQQIKKVSEDNYGRFQKNRKSTDESALRASNKDMNVLDKIIIDNIERTKRFKEHTEMQKQMIQLQQELKKERQIKNIQEKKMQEQKYLQNLGVFDQKRKKQKDQFYRFRHQNMALYEELQNIKSKQYQQFSQFQTKIANSHQIQKLEEQEKLKIQRLRKQQEQHWKRTVSQQLQEKKFLKQLQLKGKRQPGLKPLIQQHEHLDMSNHARFLQRQIQQQKEKKAIQTKRYMQMTDIPTDSLSPAVLGKMPYSYDRKLQLQLVDRRLGIQRNVLKKSGQNTLSTIAFQNINFQNNQDSSPSPTKVQIDKQLREKSKEKQGSSGKMMQLLENHIVRNQQQVRGNKLNSMVETLNNEKNVQSPSKDERNYGMRSFDIILARPKVYSII